MTELEIFFEIHTDLSREGPGGDAYTKKAFQVLPKLDEPRILDVGCGPGGPTLELARLTSGHVVGLDMHQPYLDRLGEKIEEAGLSDRVEAVYGSMFEMAFPDDSFDIIWAEGSIYIIGFERGLTEWRRFLKPEGYLVANEVAWLRPDPPPELSVFWQENYPGIKTIPENLSLIPACGYEIIGHFVLPKDAWWIDYYSPLEKRLQALRKKYSDDPKALEVLGAEQAEIELFRKYHEWYGAVFFVMRKGG
jgi:ubiquinone/menaquinone biosynthesis C-methylase UbiE